VQALFGVEVNSSAHASFFSSAFKNQNFLNIKKKKSFTLMIVTSCYRKISKIFVFLYLDVV
jgi:hypothetical protein